MNDTQNTLLTLFNNDEILVSESDEMIYRNHVNHTDTILSNFFMLLPSLFDLKMKFMAPKIP